MPEIDHSNPFELDEARRTCKALEELRSRCCTTDASKSFEVFEREIRANLEQEFIPERKGPFYKHSAESKARALAADFRPRVLGLDNNIAAATMKIINAAPKPKSSMIRSKTMGDVEQSTKATVGGTTEKDAKVGWRRPSYLKAQKEVTASEMALGTERRVTAAAAAQWNTRRGGIGIGGPSSAAFATETTMLPLTTKPKVRQSLPGKSSGSKAGSDTNAETLKRVFSGSVRSLRRMGRSFTGMSELGDA